MRLFKGVWLGRVKWLFENGGTLSDALALWGEWNAIEDPWDTTAGFKARGLVAVKLGNIVADQTATTADDLIVDQVEKFLNNDSLVALVVGVLVQLKGQPDDVVVQALTSGEHSDKLAEAVTAAGLNWSVILEAIKAIMALISMFTLKSPAPVSGEGGSKPAGNPFEFIQSY